MPTTVSVLMKSLSGEAGPFTLFLRTSAGLLLNTGGDALTESENPPGTKTGIWTGSVAETLAVDYSAGIYEGTTETAANIVWDGGLKLGETELRPDWPLARLAVLDSAVGAQITAIETFATRITTGIVQDGAVWQFTANMLELGPSSSGGDATLAKQEQILTAIQGSTVIQVASPNVSGNLVLTQGDDYDGTANPRASWTVTTDYTDGWSVALTIRDVDDAVIYTTAGTVVSATVVAVTIAAPTGLAMTGCPGQWQGKFDVQLTKAGKKKTIALGVCYINEDQTR